MEDLWGDERDESIKLICVILISRRSSIIDKWPVINKEEPRTTFVEMSDKWLSSEKSYKLSDYSDYQYIL